MEFKDKVVIITGANSGIGKLLSEHFLRQEAIVIGFDIEKNDNIHVLNYIVDVRDYGAIERAVSEIIKLYQKIDIVINCAGGASSRVLNENKSFEFLSLNAIDWGIDVNLKGPIYMARAVINQMIKQNYGVIINVGSVSGVTGSGTAVDYASAKSGLIGLTKSLALLGAAHQIRCCMVSPGPVLTRPEMSKMTTPMGRACSSLEVVDLIMYLCGEKATFISGDNYMIDGARSCGGMKHEE